MDGGIQADVSLGWNLNSSGENLTTDEIKEIARAAGTTVPAIYARIKRGDTGEYLRRKRGPQGSRAGAGKAQAAKPIKANAQPQPQARPSWKLPRTIEDKAEALGIPLQIVLARVDAGWPPARLLDPVKRWRGVRRPARV